MSDPAGRPRIAMLALLLPGLLPLVLLFLLPLCWGLLGSLGLDDAHPGLTTRHYAEVFARPALRRALFMSLYYGIAPVIVALPAAVGLALLLRRPFLGQRLFGILYKIPLAVPGIVAALVVMTLFDRGGFADRLLAPLGFVFPRLIRDPWGLGVILTSVWKQLPMMTLVCAGAFASVPDDVSQAARAFGAGRWRTFWHVELPLALPGISAAMLLAFVATLGYYAIPDLLGPAWPQPLAVHMVSEFGLGHRGLVDALGMVMAAMAMAVLVAHDLATRRAARLHDGDPSVRTRP